MQVALHLYVTIYHKYTEMKQINTYLWPPILAVKECPKYNTKVTKEVNINKIKSGTKN